MATAIDPRKLRAIHNGLDGAFERAEASIEDYDLAKDQIVVFSDHHRGRGDKADDFRTNVYAYTAALGYYLEQGYRLFLLGDAEELWEERPRGVLKEYAEVLSLESEFRRTGAHRLERFWGNHDDLWSEAGPVGKHLQGAVHGPIEVREGLRMRVQRAQQDHATLFFVHGHQGTTGSDRYGRLARLPVRYFWRPFQRLTGYSATTPASRYDLRETHDRAMFEWARGRGPGVVLIAGHTHRPVFAGSTPDPPPTRPIAHLQAALTEAQSRDDIDAASAVRVELEYALAAQRRPVESITVEPPCYFNTGCCSYPDGDVTGVELANGEIRLVRWPTNLRELQSESGGTIEPDRRILARANLADILDVVSSPPRHARFEKHLITPEPA